jgi:UPF0755 protein
MTIAGDRLKKPLIIVVVAVVLIIAALAVVWGLVAPVRRGSTESVIITVPPGTSVQRVAGDLKAKGLIRSDLAFRLLARLRGATVQVGEYDLNAGLSSAAILRKLASGDVINYSFTVPEGYTVRQIGALLEQKGYINRERWDALVYGQTDAFAAYDFLPAKAPSPGPGAPKGFRVSRLEGFLFPDTYQFVRGMTEEQLLKQMLDRFTALFTPAMVEQAKASGRSVLDVVKLASIVEREAQVDAERPVIAGVFTNRLRIGMSLGSCATVNYLLERPRDILLLTDLEINSPYNTYRNLGLPPGPIANPGIKSLEAALQPGTTEYLYFVSKFDGTHAFAKTLAEHEANSRKYASGK